MTRPHPLLLRLAAGHPLPQVSDIEVLEKSAHEHRMVGLLMSSILKGDVAYPPEQVHRLAMFDLQSRAIQERNWTRLREVVDRLAEAGVEVAAFKGVTAEARWYDRMGERPSTDIDLLVDPATVDRARDIVAALAPRHPILPHVTELVARGILETLAVPVGDVVIDIHFALLEIGLPLAHRHDVWARTQLIPHPHGGSVRVLDRETALIHFLLHLNKDRFSRLLWYVDVVRLLERESELDWDYIDRLARAEGLETPVYLSLDAVSADLGLSNPYEATLTGWKPVVWRRLWGPGTRLLGEQGLRTRRHRQRVLSIMFKGRKGQALRWWFAKLFPPAPILAWRYPWQRGPYHLRLVASRFVGAWNSAHAAFRQWRAR